MTADDPRPVPNGAAAPGLLSVLASYRAARQELLEAMALGLNTLGGGARPTA
ncbi:hypothetical protein [Kitasatospora sp. KL5]|uniref:hypothetical protein n=1 Tax=Kitasatospora sp. KL5 TaxID=3425125 RepID=UPI003D6E44D6